MDRDANGDEYYALPDTVVDEDEEENDHDLENPWDVRRRERARRAWQRIATEVRSGDMLLRAAAIDPTVGQTLSTDEK